MWYPQWYGYTSRYWPFCLECFVNRNWHYPSARERQLLATLKRALQAGLDTDTIRDLATAYQTLGPGGPDGAGTSLQ